MNTLIPDQHDTDSQNIIIDFEKIDNQCKYHSLADSFCNDSSFSIIHLNARSIKNKFDIFQILICNSGVEWAIICLSETWLKTDIVNVSDVL